MRIIDSFEKTLMLGNIEGRRKRGWQRMRWLDGITDHDGDDMMDMSLSKLRELAMEKGGWAWCSPWGHKELDMTEQLNWTDGKAIALLQTIFLTFRFRRSKWLTYLKQSRWYWSDQCMTNFKMAVWADCADFVCSHLSLPIKLLPTACWEGQELNFGQASTPCHHHHHRLLVS